MRLSTLLLGSPTLIFANPLGVASTPSLLLPTSLIRSSQDDLSASLTSDQISSRVTPPPIVLRPAESTQSEVVGACDVKCVAQFPAGLSYGWQRALFTNTVTVAMVAHLTWANGSTAIRTLPAKILSAPGFSMIRRNEHGTIVQPITIDRGPWGNFTTTLSYPTAFTEYPNSYWWSGVLRTKTNDRVVCATATAARQLEFESHPSYDSIDHSSHLYYPKEYLNGSNLDGVGYVFGKVPIQILNFYEHAFPGEVGFSSCSETRPTLPTMAPLTTTTYITITRTLPFVIEPNVYRQPTVTQTLIAPTPLGGGIKSAISAALPTPLADHQNKGKNNFAAVLHRFELRDDPGCTPDTGNGCVYTTWRTMTMINGHDALYDQPETSNVAESSTTTTTTTQTVAIETTVTQTLNTSLPTSTTLSSSKTTRRLPPPFNTMTPQILGQMGAFTVHTEYSVTASPLMIPPAAPAGQLGAFTVRTEHTVTSAPAVPTPVVASSPSLPPFAGPSAIPTVGSSAAKPTGSTNFSPVGIAPGPGITDAPSNPAPAPSIPAIPDSISPNTQPLPQAFLPKSPTSITIGGAPVPVSIIYAPPPQPAQQPPSNIGSHGANPPPSPTIIIAGQTATPGQVITVNDTPVAITSRDGAVYAAAPNQPPVLLLAPAGSGANTGGRPAALPMTSGGEDGPLFPGIALRPLAVPIPIAVGNGDSASTATLMPVAASFAPGVAPAFVIDGQTVAAGGAAVTLGTGASETVLSLATDAMGDAILDVNGAKTTLPAAAVAISSDIPSTLTGMNSPTGPMTAHAATGSSTSTVTSGTLLGPKVPRSIAYMTTAAAMLILLSPRWWT